MGTLVVFAASILATMLLTAWLLHRHKAGLSPIPSLPAKDDGDNSDTVHDFDFTNTKGRPIL